MKKIKLLLLLGFSPINIFANDGNPTIEEKAIKLPPVIEAITRSGLSAFNLNNLRLVSKEANEAFNHVERQYTLGDAHNFKRITVQQLCANPKLTIFPALIVDSGALFDEKIFHVSKELIEILDLSKTVYLEADLENYGCLKALTDKINPLSTELHITLIDPLNDKELEDWKNTAPQDKDNIIFQPAYCSDEEKAVNRAKSKMPLTKLSSLSVHVENLRTAHAFMLFFKQVYDLYKNTNKEIKFPSIHMHIDGNTTDFNALNLHSTEPHLPNQDVTLADLILTAQTCGGKIKLTNDAQLNESRWPNRLAAFDPLPTSKVMMRGMERYQPSVVKHVVNLTRPITHTQDTAAKCNERWVGLAEMPHRKRAAALDALQKHTAHQDFDDYQLILWGLSFFPISDFDNAISFLKNILYQLRGHRNNENYVILMRALSFAPESTRLALCLAHVPSIPVRKNNAGVDEKNAFQALAKFYLRIALNGLNEETQKTCFDKIPKIDKAWLEVQKEVNNYKELALVLLKQPLEKRKDLCLALLENMHQPLIRVLTHINPDYTDEAIELAKDVTSEKNNTYMHDKQFFKELLKAYFQFTEKHRKEIKPYLKSISTRCTKYNDIQCILEFLLPLPHDERLKILALIAKERDPQLRFVGSNEDKYSHQSVLNLGQVCAQLYAIPENLREPILELTFMDDNWFSQGSGNIDIADHYAAFNKLTAYKTEDRITILKNLLAMHYAWNEWIIWGPEKRKLNLLSGITQILIDQAGDGDLVVGSAHLLKFKKAIRSEDSFMAALRFIFNRKDVPNEILSTTIDRIAPYFPSSISTRHEKHINMKLVEFLNCFEGIDPEQYLPFMDKIDTLPYGDYSYGTLVDQVMVDLLIIRFHLKIQKRFSIAQIEAALKGYYWRNYHYHETDVNIMKNIILTPDDLQRFNSRITNTRLLAEAFLKSRNAEIIREILRTKNIEMTHRQVRNVINSFGTNYYLYIDQLREIDNPHWERPESNLLMFFRNCSSGRLSRPKRDVGR